MAIRIGIKIGIEIRIGTSRGIRTGASINREVQTDTKMGLEIQMGTSEIRISHRTGPRDFTMIDQTTGHKTGLSTDHHMSPD